MTLTSAMRVEPTPTLVHPQVADRRTDYRITFAVILLAVLAFSLLQSIVLPALPTIQASLHVKQSSATWVLNANIGSAIGSAVMAGLVASHVGAHHLPAVTGYADGFLLLLLAAVIATIASLAISTTPKSR